MNNDQVAPADVLGSGAGGPLPPVSPWRDWGGWIQYLGGVVIGNGVQQGPGTLNVAGYFINNQPFNFSTVLPIAGGTMTGPITLAADPVTASQPATKRYVDAQIATAGQGKFLALTGGTMTGQIVLAADPTLPLASATKQYVDARTPITTDAPANNNPYVRENNAWIPMPAGLVIPDAPFDGSSYSRNNGAWTNIYDGGTVANPLNTHLQIQRANNPGARPVSRNSGELFINFADAQLSVWNSNIPGVQDLLGVPFFSTLASYAQGQPVNYGGNLYTALVPVAAGPWNPAQWGQYFSSAGGTITGGVKISYPASVGNGVGLVINKQVATQSNVIIGQFNGSVRWQMVLGDNTAESGSNAGDNFDLNRYSDTQTLLDTVLTINRATGYIKVAHTIAVNDPPSGVGDLLDGAMYSQYQFSYYYGANSYIDKTGSTWRSITPNLAIGVFGSVTPNTVSIQCGMAGAVAGAPVTFPYNWQFHADTGQFSSPSGIHVGDGTGFISDGFSTAGTTYSTNLVVYDPNWQQMIEYAQYDSVAGQTWRYFYLGSGTIQFLYTGDAYKPGGGSWLNNSDARIKKVNREYTAGLEEIEQLQPVCYIYKGNATDSPPSDLTPAEIADPKHRDHVVNTKSLKAPYRNSSHYHQAVEGKEFVGLIAQDVEDYLPELVIKRKGYIDGKLVDDFRDLDVSPLVYALVNAVKELSTRVKALEAITQ